MPLRPPGETTSREDAFVTPDRCSPRRLAASGLFNDAIHRRLLRARHVASADESLSISWMRIILIPVRRVLIRVRTVLIEMRRSSSG
jgi:hypothetical protein